MPAKYLKKIAIPSNISTYLSQTLIIITIATTLLIGGILVIEQTLHFKKISKQKREEYIEDQKIYIQEIVKNEFQYIQIQNEVFKQNINSKIRSNVYQAINTAETIYKKYDGKKSDEEIQALIVATISSLKFDMEYEEVFISTLDGQGIYYPRKPDFTGKQMLQFKDTNGSSVVLEEINLLKRNSEGFLDYNLKSKFTTESSPLKKITFVKKFGHYNWYFGSKQYMDDYFPKFKDEIAQKISSVRFRHGGYLFLNQVNGIPIVMDGKVYHGDINLLKADGSNRNIVFLKELETSKSKADGDFFYYKWNKIDETILTPKCAFVQLFRDYDWIIGAGFYLDELENTIKIQQKMLWHDQQKSILIIVIILFALLILEALIIYHFNKVYKSDFERFFNFFYTSQNSFSKININNFYFDEFKQAGIAANKMITLREEIELTLKEEQKKATESDRLKSAFLANMSHEIRTPMNSILGFSELLDDDMLNENDKKTFVKLIRKNGEILLNLINDIIDISKIEANLLTIRKRPFKLNKILKEIEFHYSELLTSRVDKDIRFNVINRCNEDTIIITDEIRLRQILDNLIGNAIKFTATGSIIVEVRMQGEKAHFSVADTGIGIPVNQQATIFERFMQAEQGHNINFGGTGLGLAISKNLIELLGGNIYVNSIPGKGSTFHFSIESN